MGRSSNIELEERLLSTMDSEDNALEPENTNFLYKLTFFSAIGGFLFGYDTGVVSGAMLLINQDFNLHTIEQELVVTVTIAVAALFSLVGGFLNKKIGRRLTIISASVLFGIGSLLLASAKGYPSLLIGRAVIGMGLGIASMSIPIYLSECAPPSVRGKIITANNLSITAGQFVAAVIDGALSRVSGGWRFMLGLAFVPALVQFIGFMVSMPESPRYHIENGHSENGLKTLQKIRGKENVREEFNAIERDIRENVSGSSSSLITTAAGRHALFIGCSLQFFQQFTGINTVMYYSATIIYMSGIVTNASAAIWLSALTSSMNFIFTLVGLYSIEKIGRRKLILASIFGSALSLTILSGGFYWNGQVQETVSVNRTSSFCSKEYFDQGCSNCVQNDDCAFCSVGGIGSCDIVNYTDSAYPCSSNTINDDIFWSKSFCPKTEASWLSLLGMMLYLISFAPGMGPVPWTVNAEIYPQSCRESGMAVSTSVNWMSNCIVSLTFLSILQVLGGPGGFALYAGFGVLGFFVIYFTLPETKGVPLESIQDLLNQGWCIPSLPKSYQNFENDGYEDETSPETQLQEN